MNGMICEAPKGGGSAGGLARYLDGYTLSSKKDSGLTQEERAAQYRDLMIESLEREDLGVGTVWEPQIGTSNGRPAAVLAVNVTSYASASQELDAYGAIGKHARVQEPTLHLIFSFSPEETLTLTNVKMVEAARTALIDMGLGDHAQRLSLHMDEAHGHVHCAVAATNPNTLLAWERYRDQYRISRACRESELAHDLRHDRGLYVIEHEPSGTKIIRETTRPERATWEREGDEARLDHQTLRAQGDIAAFESHESYGEVVEVAVRERAEAMVEEGLPATWADAHRIAASYGSRLTKRDDGTLYLEIRERLTDEEREAEAERMKAAKLLAGGYETQKVEAPKTRATGTFVKIDAAKLGIAADFQSAEESESAFAEVLRKHPSYVSQVLVYVEGHAMINRTAVDKFIASRVTNPTQVAALGDFVFANDHTIEMLSADAPNPLYVRKDLRDLEQRVVQSATRLSQTKDHGFDAPAFARSVERFEARKRSEQIAKGQQPNFALTQEQRALCESVAMHRLTWASGNAGSGKTTAMEVLKIYAAETGRPIIGLATGQAAARKLGREAGITTYNLTRLRVDEARGKQLLPYNAIAVVDESSMTSYKAMEVVTDLCERRHATLAGIGDGAQIKNIEAGSPHHVLMEIARDAGTYCELKEVRRQQGELAWMGAEVEAVGEAIRTGDAAGVERFVNTLDQHGIFVRCDSRDDAVRATAAWYLENPKAETIVTTRDRLAAAHGSRIVRDGLGLTGKGAKFEFERGTIELSTGDRVQFGRNSRNLKIDNNDLGTVTRMKFNQKSNSWAITAKLERNGEEITFNPAIYKNVVHGYFLTAFKSQGQSVYRAAALIDSQTDANTANVQLTRSTHELRAFYSSTSFEDATALGKHLGQRITPADDYLRIERVIARTGGPNTIWAKHVRAAQADANHPLRRQFVREQRVRWEALESQRLTIITRLGGEMRTTTDAEKRAGILRRLQRETRSIAAQQDKNAKTTFASWVCDRKALSERDDQRMGIMQRERAKAREAKRSRETPKRQSSERGWVR